MNRFCNYCNCAVDLHTEEEGCICEDTDGHRATLDATDLAEYCDCLLTPSDFDKDLEELTHE